MRIQNQNGEFIAGYNHVLRAWCSQINYPKLKAEALGLRRKYFREKEKA